MPKYIYKAKKEDGSMVSGMIQALDEYDLHQKLKLEDKYLLEAKEDGTGRRTRRIKAKALSEYCRQIGTLSSAGVSLVRALNIVAEDESNTANEHSVYDRVLKQVRQGKALSEAMQDMGDAFPELLIQMLRSSETAGNLDVTAKRMADYYDKQFRLNTKVKNSTFYPKILSVVIVVVVVLMMSFVLPQFKDLFDQMEVLPAPTRILFGLSDLVTQKWYLLIGVLGVLIVTACIVLRIRQVRYQVDRVRLYLPLFGRLNRIIYTARFARTVSSLYSSGIPIVQALQIGRKIVGNLYIDEQFDGVIATVRSGGNLSDALDQVEGFTKKLVSAVRIGEETGSLDHMLNSIADTLEYESNMAIDRMVATLEPVLIVTMAVIVGFIMIAVLLPLYGSYDSISSTGY